MMDQNKQSELFQAISKLPVIDTHEHLMWDEMDRCNTLTDVLSEYLTHYLKSDIISAGLSLEKFQKVIDIKGDISERWAIVEPYWEVSRYTGYGRALDISVKAIYGIDGVNRDTIEPLNRLFLEQQKPGHYQKVLKDLCNIETSLLDVWTFHIDKPSPFFRYIWQPQNFIVPSEPEGTDILSHIEKKHSIKVKGLDDWLQAMEAELDFVLSAYHARTIKSSIAYGRSLRFEKVKYARAKQLFTQVMDKEKSKSNEPESRMEFPPELQDFMMHYVLKLANERNLTFQFHTGLLEGNGNMITNSDPSLMTNLFLEYRNVDFDLFHISYPYQNVACALAKMFPNVFIDMCWAHIISPSASVAALDDFLDAIPYNKISAFGGDYLFVDGVYGHLYISRENISRVLESRITRGLFSESKAMDIAKALYYDNPKRIFKL